MNDDLYDQAQDELGAEINERELRDAYPALDEPVDWLPTGQIPDYVVNALDDEYEPDDGALVGAILARCGWEIDDLATPTNVATLVDFGRDDLATTIRDLDHMLLLLGTVRDEVSQALAGLMEKDLEIVAGMGVERSRTMRTEWDKDGAWRATRYAIVERWGTVSETKDDRQLIDRVLADVATAYSTTPKVNGLKALGISPDEYRATSRSERWNIKVTT